MVVAITSIAPGVSLKVKPDHRTTLQCYDYGMHADSRTYSSLVLSHWRSFEKHVSQKEHVVPLDGRNLTLSQVVAVARHGSTLQIESNALHNLERSHVALQDSLAHGDVIYGVNTGFGGSANTRTDKVDSLQRTLLREFNSGVLLTPSEPQPTSHSPSVAVANGNGHAASAPRTSFLRGKGLPAYDEMSLNCMPVAWTRAAMLIRLNSLVVGCSGVRRAIVERLLQLLELDIIPRIPMHGSISACGDLAPLSYIGSAIQGKPNISCTVGALKGNSKMLAASTALAEAGVRPEKVEAKEALAIMNGTAVSCAVASLALHDTHGLVVMSEILTAMSVEALGGTDESFDPFFARVRPHPGQIDSSKSIFNFLRGSKLLDTHKEGGIATLKQDRYSIRTAAQWLGPILEDVQLAHEQLSTECNSVTDNPLIDVKPGCAARHLHGGNFQARAVTSAMEKVRISLQSVGRLLFAQCTETINPATSQGLPPNLVADEPSESFVMKSVDIMVAALLSELSFLANPVGSHVQTAEMGNQALNSLALISARYALTAVDLASKLVAAHLLVACQALDLRVMERIFFEKAHAHMYTIAKDWYERLCSNSDRSSAEYIVHDAVDEIRELQDVLWATFRGTYEDTTILDSRDRFQSVARSLQPHLLSHMVKYPNSCPGQAFGARSAVPKAIEEWTENAAESLRSVFHATRDAYLTSPDPYAYLGRASRQMYRFVRHDLEVPFLNTDVLTKDGFATPESDEEEPETNGFVNGYFVGSESVKSKRTAKNTQSEAPPTIGTFVTRIYTAVRDGSLYAQAIDCLDEARW